MLTLINDAPWCLQPHYLNEVKVACVHNQYTHNFVISFFQLFIPVTPAKLTWNRPQTNKNCQIRGEIGLQSVLIQFCWFSVGWCSGRQICWGEIIQTCLKDLSPTNCRLSVGYMSVWCRFCRGAFRVVSVLIWSPMVDGLLVVDRLCIGHMLAELTPIQGRFKTESSLT